MPNDRRLLCEAAPLLIDWFAADARPLPWRTDPSPYHVWLSEIMLQQTRIEAVIPYYERFLRELPDIASLAAVEDERLMKLWEGLGYYSRARNLKAAAIAVMSEHSGELPSTAAALQKLPGIGPYTAGAIASIAYGEPEPAVDGNVLRVVSRLLADPSDIMQPSTRRRISDALAETYPAQGDGCRRLTQAWMELGERVCTPNGTPHCEECPLAALCRAHATAEEEAYPVRSAKRPRRIEQRTVLLLLCGDRFAVRRRPESGLLAGLWEFPCLEGHADEEQVRAYLDGIGLCAGLIAPTAPVRHIFTHIEWHMQGYTVDCPHANDTAGLTWVTAAQWRDEYAAPTAYRAFSGLVLNRGS